MPVNIPEDLPAAAVLESENIFVMKEERAKSQDIRPMRVIIMNLMPTKVETEIQLLRVLSNTPLQLDIDLLRSKSHVSKNVSSEYLERFYKTFDEIHNNKYDGMIITGAPIENIDFTDVDYWSELSEIMAWSKEHVFSTLHICWGAQAGLYYHYNIPKHRLESKISGVFMYRVIDKKDPLLRGFDDVFYLPQSRHTQNLEADILKNPHLHMIAVSAEAGPGIIVDEENNVFITGHFEYDASTLSYEYERDVKAGMDPHVPDNYFEDDDPSKDPIVRWRSHATLFFTNWLNYYVYQRTEYDLDKIGKK